jgi:hypothetical protein
MTAKRWMRRSIAFVAGQLRELGHKVGPTTVRALLRKAGYALRCNVKTVTGPDHPDRNTQFERLFEVRDSFLSAGLPVISVDTKKKELIGNFKNNGRTWRKEPDEVDVHDFADEELVRTVPFGIYDPALTRGYMYVGTSADTPAFAVNAICSWWRDHGKQQYPDAKRVLILADTGGSNGCHPRAFKYELQEKFADVYGVDVVLCHYPAGCSKWNPIEHRLFSAISINWAGIPLRSLDIMLGLMRATTNKSGLNVVATLVPGVFPTGQKVTDQQMKSLNITRDTTCPKWNYTIGPRPAPA